MALIKSEYTPNITKFSKIVLCPLANKASVKGQFKRKNVEVEMTRNYRQKENKLSLLICVQKRTMKADQVTRLLSFLGV
jgi:hypothetical protein